MVGWSQYRQSGSRTSPSIQRQVRSEVPVGLACRSWSVIMPPSVGRSSGRSPGRRGGETSLARLSSHQVQAQGSQERLLGVIAAACGACEPPLKFPDIFSSRPYPKYITSSSGNKAAVTDNRSPFCCIAFCRPGRRFAITCGGGGGGGGVVADGWSSPAGSGLAGIRSSSRWAKL
jgi:hypothetical protein